MLAQNWICLKTLYLYYKFPTANSGVDVYVFVHQEQAGPKAYILLSLGGTRLVQTGAISRVLARYALSVFVDQVGRRSVI